MLAIAFAKYHNFGRTSVSVRPPVYLIYRLTLTKGTLLDIKNDLLRSIVVMGVIVLSCITFLGNDTERPCNSQGLGEDADRSQDHSSGERFCNGVHYSESTCI